MQEDLLEVVASVVEVIVLARDEDRLAVGHRCPPFQYETRFPAETWFRLRFPPYLFSPSPSAYFLCHSNSLLSASSGVSSAMSSEASSPSKGSWSGKRASWRTGR